MIDYWQIEFDRDWAELNQRVADRTEREQRTKDAQEVARIRAQLCADRGLQESIACGEKDRA